MIEILLFVAYLGLIAGCLWGGWQLGTWLVVRKERPRWYQWGREDAAIAWRFTGVPSWARKAYNQGQEDYRAER